MKSFIVLIIIFFVIAPVLSCKNFHRAGTSSENFTGSKKADKIRIAIMDLKADDVSK